MHMALVCIYIACVGGGVCVCGGGTGCGPIILGIKDCPYRETAYPRIGSPADNAS